MSWRIDLGYRAKCSRLSAEGLSKGKLDAALLRRERGVPESAYRVVLNEPPWPGMCQPAEFPLGHSSFGGDFGLLIFLSAPETNLCIFA